MNNTALTETEIINLEEETLQNLALRDDIITSVIDAIANDDLSHAQDIFLELSVSDQADLIEKIDHQDRVALINYCDQHTPPNSSDNGIQSLLYSELDSEVRLNLLHDFSPKHIARIVSDLESDDALDMIQTLDPEIQQQILRKLSSTTRAAVEEGLTFPEESAGRLMQREVVAIPQFWTVGKTVDYLRAAAEHLPGDFTSIYIVDPTYHVVGEVLVSRVISGTRSQKISELKRDTVHCVSATTDQEDVAFLFRKEHLYSVPVLDADERLIGVITADDVMDVIQEEAQEDILKMAGVSSSSDIYKAVFDSTKSRFSWLVLNLMTAIIASLVISMFAATLEQIVALAILMPIVASMGGNAGTQTLTIAVRALATKELSSANALRFIGKETMIGFLNGLLFAVLVGLVTWFWFDSTTLGVIIGAAMIINMIAAGLFGIMIPLVLDRLNIDPALASGVFLTTVTDVIGFLAFLGLAALILF